MFPGERITELRESLGIPKSKLAEKVHVSRSSISEYEKGTTQPSMSVLLQLADVFGVSLDYLLGRTSVKMSIRQIEQKLSTRNGLVPIDTFFKLSDADKEIVGLLLSSLAQKVEHREK